MNLILASSSKYRREQLKKLHLNFTCHSPNIDETPLALEKPADLAIRLAKEKARHILNLHPNGLVIGSDQVAFTNNKIIGKPSTYDKALAQLQEFSNQTVVFYTAVSVTNKQREIHELIITECKFIDLDNTQINNYLQTDKPFDTAGSAKIEQLGIALMEYVRSDDPSALIGIPLIALCRILRKFGLDPLINT